jgi:hypothetical protein
MKVRSVVLASLVTACASGGLDVVRYRNEPPVTVVNDRVHTPKQPAEIDFVKMAEYFDAFLYRRIVRFTQQLPDQRAANVNSMDEAPDSTWFRNRIGVREVSLEEIRSGNKAATDPMLNKPWTITSTKVGGKSIGFLIKDSTGAKFVLKFDQLGLAEAETAANVISSRLVWAFGLHTTDDYIVNFKRSDLIIGPGAKVKPLFGASKPLTQKILDEKLALVNISPDGSIRGMASRFLVGKPLGPWPRTGTRPDDPNDRVPHELRRELRGAYALFSWLDHVDMKADQTVDMYETDPADKSVSYVKHYHIDFGKTFGVYAEADSLQYVGHSYLIDFADMFSSLLSLGAWRRPWEGRTNPRITGVGIFESRGYDPGRWKPVTPSYLPLLATDRFDAFWGAKIIIKFTEAQIRAAITEGKLSDPRAADYLTRVLLERQRKTARYWFDRVNPLDQFEVRGDELCFDDLNVRYDLNRAPVSYRATAFDFEGKKLDGLQVKTGERGRVCALAVRPSTSEGGYVIVRLETLRTGFAVPPTLVHLARDPAGTLRVIGIRRL